MRKSITYVTGMAGCDNVLMAGCYFGIGGNVGWKEKWMKCRKYMWVREWFLERMCESVVTWNYECYKDGWVGGWADVK